MLWLLPRNKWRKSRNNRVRRKDTSGLWRLSQDATNHSKSRVCSTAGAESEPGPGPAPASRSSTSSSGTGELGMVMCPSSSRRQRTPEARRQLRQSEKWMSRAGVGAYTESCKVIEVVWSSAQRRRTGGLLTLFPEQQSCLAAVFLKPSSLEKKIMLKNKEKRTLSWLRSYFYICVCIYIYICVRICVYICACVCTYIHTVFASTAIIRTMILWAELL